MQSDLTASIMMLLACVALAAVNVGTWRLARRSVNATVLVDLIFYFVAVKLVLYYILPYLLRLASGYRFEQEDGVAVWDLARLYMIESISWFMWGVGLLIALRLTRVARLATDDAAFFARFRSESRLLMVVIASGFILTQIVALAGLPVNPVFEIFRSLFFFVGLPLGPFLIVMAPGSMGRWVTVLGLVTSALSVLSLSTRGAIVYLVLFSVFLVWFVSRRRAAKIVILTTTGALAMVYFLLGGLVGGTISIDDTGRITLSTSVDQDKKGSRTSWEEVEWRFGASTRMGTRFLTLYDRGDAAGIAPIRNSFLGFLPRSMNPEKPHPSTIDGTDIYSQGMYVISREINGYGTYSMVEFPTGAHFYWEFGIPGVLILSLLSGVYIACCANAFSRLGGVAIPLMVATFKPWGFMDPKIWISDVVLQIYQLLLPALVLVACVHGGIRVMRWLAPRGTVPTARSGGR